MSLDISKEYKTNITTTSVTTAETSGAQISQKPTKKSIFTQTTSQTTTTQENKTPLTTTANESEIPEQNTGKIPEKENTTTQPTDDTSSEPKDEKTNGKKSLIEEYATKNNYKDGVTVDEIIADIKTKERCGEQLTKEEMEIISLYNKPLEEEKTKEEKIDAEYAKIQKSNKTIYQNTSVALDRYLEEHDEKYKNLKTEKEKQAYRDEKIHNLIKTLIPGAKTKKNGTLNISKEQRSTALLQIASMCAIAEKENTSLESLSTIPLDNLKKKIQDQEIAQMKAIAKQLDINNPDKTTEQKLHDFADQYLTNTDPEYKNLSGEEKEKYLLNKSAELLSGLLDIKISPEELKPGKNMFMKETALSLFKTMLDKDIAFTDFVNLSAKEQAKIIKDSFPNIDKLLKNMSAKERQDAMVFMTRNEMIAQSQKENPTDRDILNELEKLKETGSLSKEQEILYKELSILESTKYIDREAKPISNIGKALLLGKSVEDLIQNQLAKISDKDIRADIKSDKINSHTKALMDGVVQDKSFRQFTLIREDLQKKGLSEKEIRAFFEKYSVKYDYMVQCSSAAAAARNNGEELGRITSFASSNLSENEIKNCAPVFKNTVKYLDDDQTSITIIKANTANQTILDAYNEGCHEYKSRESCIDIALTVTSSNKVSEEGKSSYTKSFIATAPAKNQVYYGQELAKVGEPAVLEGLAAAEQSVDSSVRNQYSSNLSKAINNSNLTSEQKANIEQARQTGQISYERSSSSEGASDKSSSTGTRTSSNTPSASRTSSGYTTTTTASYSSSTGGSGSSSGTASTSGSKPTYVAFGSTNYGDQVTKALSDKKERVQERITQIIDNYQKTTKAQEAKAEKQADTTSRDATSQAAKSAEKEAKVVKTFIESPQASGNIDAKTIQELKTAYSSGGMKGLYEKLGTLGETVQERFLSFFAKYSDGNSLHSFASSFSNNKSVILSLYQYSNDPSLLAYLGESATMDLLSKGKIKLKDFLKYASPSTIALYISDLNKTGNHELLKQIFGLLNLSQASYVQQHTSKPTLGGDDWREQLQSNMSRASGFEMADGLAMGSDRAPMGRSYDKMKQRGPFYFNA